ncbi:type IV secretion system protein VirB11 [Sphingomonas sp. PP-F2F-G114-C0414]|uniref:P-type DNA transfer ATPase VirB11 n=1 Tax=Sphingomonas sp. PP-F2F-G114-C0414 TaxID=2135662 RepID=UPI000EF8BF9F|nr:P-type DNA transfer ATPase VirB11 [Sphingomonas sp. PP-F2F-G114-C0414]RMB24877.1 type IV secretion system protein VirB11 [Sphingomonas sp. PP-F2F-G114-C0414]
MSSATTTDHYLDSCLAPLAPYLALPELTDIFINRPGEIWIETLGEPPRRIETPDLTVPALQRLAKQIAAASSQGVNRENPLLAASLPSGVRVQVVLPPATRGESAFAFRKNVVADFGLDDYADRGAFRDTLLGPLAVDIRPATEGLKRQPAHLYLRGAVRDRRNILISGGTSSGKTTFLNALLHEIPREERLVLIEDTPELRLVHENAVGLLTPRGALGEARVTAEDLLIASLRMRPDRIILGEIRGSEAFTFLRAVNTGHPGSIATIHADSPMGSIMQLGLLIMQAGMKMSWEDIISYVKVSLDIVVQLRRGSSGRYVHEISEVVT